MFHHFCRAHRLCQLIKEIKLANGVKDGKKPKKVRAKFKRPRQAAVAASAAITRALVADSEGDASVAAAGKPPLHGNIGVHITIVCSDIFFCCAINPSLTLTLFCC